MKSKIDVVVLWVDGNDPEWQRKKAAFQGDVYDSYADLPCRYRDWDNFKFWFRGIEKFMPWVNHVYLVTDGQKPSWINTKNEKLTIVAHNDIMPSEALPTYNSRAIELCINHIKGLADCFVYFNDDMFITAPCREEDFFVDGLPVDNPVLGANIPVRGKNGFGETLVTAYSLGIINGHFRKRDVISRARNKWYGCHLGLRGFISAMVKKHQNFFDGFKNHHCCQPFLKSTFDHVWQNEPEIIRETVLSHFRADRNVSQWFLRYWQLCENNFSPASLKDRYFANVADYNVDEVARIITSGKYKSICINDADTADIKDFEYVKQTINAAFESILPIKSYFEI